MELTCRPRQVAGNNLMSCLARLQIFGHLRCLVFVYPILGLLITSAAALGKPNNIDISYSPPKDPSHEKLATLLQERRVLEQLQQVLMPIRLPRKLTLTLAGCDGESNAFYDNDKVQVCYEMVDEIVRKAPKERTA